jgi:microcystin degradation protein MlrC
MQVVIGSISHETNTFSNVLTGLPQFNENLYLGQDIVSVFRGKHAIASAFIQVAEAEGFELLPTVWASATPSGFVTDAAFTHLLARLLQPIEAAKPVDGVLLHLHGAMVTQSLDDPEGEILAAVRGVVGRGVPIVVTLDLHANIAERMVREADVLIGYDTYPHVDQFERGLEAAQLMASILQGRVTPTMAMQKPPMIVSPQRQKTSYYPMNALINLAHELEADDSIVNVTVAGGYPFADLEFAGMTMVVTTNNRPKIAQHKADQLAALAWKLRRDFLADVVPPTEAVAEAMAAPGGPVVLADHADNPGGGAPCDGTVLLQTLLALGAENAVLAVLADPEAVATLLTAGVGATVTLPLGGRTDRLHGPPLTVTGTVKLISDGTFWPLGPMASGLASTMGRTVVFTCQGVDVIVTEKRIQPTDLELYRSVGIEPTRKQILAVKSAVHFRASHEPIATKIIEVDTPGIHSARLSAFNYTKLRRPIFPLDVELLGIAELKSRLTD